MKINKNVILLAAIMLLTACQHHTIKQSDATLYYNGDIITMQGDEPQMAQAIVEKLGKIAFVGDFKVAEKQFSKAHQVDLQGQTLLPGFIDPHSHFGMVSNTMGAS